MSDRVIIIDYKMGNVASVEKAFRAIDAHATISDKKEDIKRATHLVLPGVGAFGDGIKNLKKRDMLDILTHRVLIDRIPFLGICLGMQLLAERGYEFGINTGLGWIKGEVIALTVDEGIRLPHMGWNEIRVVNDDVLFKGIPDRNFYFVHSYHLKPTRASLISSSCEYGQHFAASIHQDNIFATQFHPEKSQISGMQVLKNFLHYSSHA